MTSDGVTDEPGRERIDHVIVLMMENRSFDHLLGYLDHPDPSYPNLTDLDASCPIDPRDPMHRRVRTSSGATPTLGVDPDHSHESIMFQMYGTTPPTGTPTMSGFIASYGEKIAGRSPRRTGRIARAFNRLRHLVTRLWRRLTGSKEPVPPLDVDIMRCFAETDVPVLATLAKEFAVLVNWHASVPGETWPNRNYAHAATSDGETNIALRFYSDRTIFEQLEDAGATWAVYQDGVAQVWAFWKLWTTYADHLHRMDQLFDDIATGQLPAYSFVEPDHGYGSGEGNSQHPGNNTIAGDSFVAGERLIGDIYNALVAAPELFARTVLLITYDEHGGFYDHVPPPHVPAPDGAAPAGGFDFTTCGVRVPAVAVSPLIPRGCVVHDPFDHASIPKTVRGQFAPTMDALTERDRAANDFLAAIPLLGAARTDIAPVSVAPRPGQPDSATGREMNDLQASLVELAGAVRSARAGAAARDVAAARPRGAESFRGPPAFEPDPLVHQAAVRRRMEPGSPAQVAVDAVVASIVNTTRREEEPP